MAYAIYGLDAIGINGAYEANGEIHWYCSEHCAINCSIVEGYRTSINYSKPAINNDAIDGTQCEWCGKTVQPAPTSGSVEVWESLGM